MAALAEQKKVEPDRKTWLGGSDAAAVLGVSGWCTAFHLWEQKTGRAANDDVDEQLQKVRERGRKLEPFIVDMLVDKLRDEGHDVKVVARNRRYFDKRHPFLSVEIDVELELDGELINGDAKSVGAYARKTAWGEVGSEEIPIEYAAQFQTGLMVSPGKRQRCVVAALRSFDDVDIFWCNRDDETIALMRKRLVKFWREHVEKDKPPAPVNLADVRAMFKRANGQSIEATDAIAAKVATWRELAKQEKDIKGQLEVVRFEIANFMGEHTLLTDGPRDLVRFEESPREGFDLRAFKSQHRDWYTLYQKETRTRSLRLAGRR